MKVDVKVLAITNILLSVMVIVLILYFHQSASSAQVSQVSATNPDITSKESLSLSNITDNMSTSDMMSLEENNSTISPSSSPQPNDQANMPPNGPPAGMKPPSGMKPPEGAMPSGSMPSGSMPSGSMPSGSGNGIASPTPSPGSSLAPSSPTDLGKTSLMGSSNGNGVSSSSQSMSQLGNSLYNYVGSMMPTVQPLIKT